MPTFNVGIAAVFGSSVIEKRVAPSEQSPAKCGRVPCTSAECPPWSPLAFLSGTETSHDDVWS
eukprot:959263-Pyramimonas_sp.AAC.2